MLGAILALAIILGIAAGVGEARGVRFRAGGYCPLNPSALCYVPRVPWEGGPQYWAKFTNSATQAWTNPNIFPVFLFLSDVSTQAEVNLDKAVNINGYVLTTTGSSASLILSNGMWNWPGNQVFVSPFGSAVVPTGVGSETIGWADLDEPDSNYGAPPLIGSSTWNGTENSSNSSCGTPSQGCGFTVQLAKRNALPVDGRPHWTNWAFLQYPNKISSSEVAHAVTTSDVISADSYWYSNAMYCAADMGGALLGTGTTLSAHDCYRSSNYGKVTSRMQQIVTVGGVPTMPVWNYTATAYKVTSGDSFITGPQLQGSVMSSLIHEARGIGYFAPNITALTMTCPVTWRDPTGCGSATQSDLVNVHTIIKNLAAVLNTQSYQWTFNANLDTMLKYGPDGKWYIFAMQSGLNDTGTYTFTLPSGFTTQTSVTVYNESRTVPISSNAFSDSFTAEYSYHIYQVSP